MMFVSLCHTQRDQVLDYHRVQFTAKLFYLYADDTVLSLLSSAVEKGSKNAVLQDKKSLR